MTKKLIRALLLMFFIMPQVFSYNSSYFWELNKTEKKVLSFWEYKKCELSQEQIPTIFIPWILASWYSEEWFEENKIKRWIPDPVTHSYDTFFYTFLKNWYKLNDVFYKDEFNVYIKWNPKQSLYIFGYDWKKDNKVTATILNQLIYKIKQNYLQYEKCELESVNIIWHSMWWIVARAMLEDMCISDLELNYIKNTIQPRNWKIRNLESIECKYPFKINKFITISTPNRWSPMSFPVWEKGDLWKTDTLLKEFALKGQIGSFTDNNFYNIIHWYDENIPNGIISLWQLIPDLQNEKSFNLLFKYLQKDWYEIKKENYPKNSFLEELNLSENIEKMWEKIDDKYYMYYTELTWNKDKNNVVWFKLNNTYKKYKNRDYNFENEYFIDNTEEIIWRDIYDKYLEDKTTYSEQYIISENIRNENWLGWDWTVPTANLYLIPNNKTKQVVNDKFKPKLIECYEFNQNKIRSEKNISLMMWKVKYELCSHTQTPILLASLIYNKVIWNKNIESLKKNQKELLYRKLLIQNIWYLNSYNITDNNFLMKWQWIKNDDFYNLLYQTNYKKLFEKNTELYNKFKNLEFNEEDGRFKLNYGSSLKWIIRYEVKSPINLIIEDEQWRKIWINPDTGMIINEIPWAWTSGNTHNSNEPEFFLVPKDEKWFHKLKTYGTWDWEYHIEITDIKKEILNNEKLDEKLIIAWNAKQNFGEDYLVAFSGSESWYKNISLDLPATLELKYQNYKTNKTNFTLRYQVRWNTKNVWKIWYKLYFQNKIILSKIEKIKTDLEINLKEIGEYDLEVFLIDVNWETLENKESKKRISIKKIEESEIKTNKALEKQKRLEKYEKIYWGRIRLILEKLNKKELEKLKNLIIKEKEIILSKYKNELIIEKIDFILNQILEYK